MKQYLQYWIYNIHIKISKVNVTLLIFFYFHVNKLLMKKIVILIIYYIHEIDNIMLYYLFSIFVGQQY